MKRVIALSAVVAMLAIFAGAAQAQCQYGYHGGYGGGYGGYGGGYGGYSSGYSQPHYHWHDTSHYDYHPGGYVRHYDHYHYVPGHYHFHQTGHWDAHW